MCRHLPLSLLGFLVGSLLCLSLTEALSEVLVESWCLADLHKDVVRLLEFAKSEQGQANLDECPVVMDLVGALLLVDYLLELTSQEQVLGFSDTVVDCVVIHLEEDSSDSFPPGTVFRDDINELLDNFFRRIIKEVNLLQLCLLIVKNFLGVLVDPIILVVDVLEFD